MKENRNYARVTDVLQRNHIAGIILILLIYAICIILFSPYPRGTDQYWNLGNIERIVHMDGVWKTNNIFPAGMPEDTENLPRPWVQNRPVTYLGAVFGIFTGNAHIGWMLMNFLLLAAILRIFTTLAVSADKVHPAFFPCAALVVFNPLIFYLGMQALPEIFNCLLAIALLGVLVKVKSAVPKALVSAVLAGMLYYQRESFVLVFLLVPAFLYIFLSGKERWLGIISFVCAVAILYAVKPLVFPAHTIHPISALHQLTEVRPGNSNMVNYLFPNPPDRSAGEAMQILGKKIVKAAELQFIPKGSEAIFFYTINLLLIPLGILLYRYKTLEENLKQEVFFIAGMVVIQAATVIIFENQNRFSSVLMPMLVLVLYRLISRKVVYQPWKVYIPLGPVIVLAGLIGFNNLSEARKDKKLLAELKIIREITDRSAVMVPFYGGRAIMLSYVVMPDYIYYFPGRYDWDNLVEVSKKLNTTWFLYPGHISFADKIAPLIEESHELAGGLRLSRLRISE